MADRLIRRHPFLVALQVTAVMALVRMLMLRTIESNQLRMALSDSLTYLLPMLVAAILCGLASQRSPRGSRGRRFWGLLAVACALLFLYETNFTYTFITQGVSPDMLGWSRSLSGVAAICLYLAVLVMTPVGRLDNARSIRTFCAITALMISLWVVLYAVWIHPVIDPGHGLRQFVSAVIIAMYPALGGTILLLLLTISIGWGGRVWTRWERLASLAIAISAIGLSLGPLWFTDEGWTPPTGIDIYTLVLAAGFVFISIAAAEMRRGDKGVRDAFEPRRARASVFDALQSMGLLFLVMITLFVVTLLLDSAEDRLFDVALFAMTILFGVRSIANIIEHSSSALAAERDPLTGTFNARALQERLKLGLRRSSGATRRLALIVIDVEEMRRLEIALGVADSDRIHQDVARTIAERLGTNGDVYFLGGDEFAVVISDCDADCAVKYARMIIEEREQDLPGRQLALTYSVGIAVFPEHADDAERLQAYAEVARSVARSSPDENVVVYSPGLTAPEQASSAFLTASRPRRAALLALAQAVDARETTMRDHQANVTRLATALAQVMNISDERIQALGFAARIHDLGKIGITDLRSALDDGKESLRAEIEEHSVLGERILEGNGFMEIARIVRSHHERWDGGGYPDGLIGPSIPLESRIIAVCDAYEAMVSGRPYAEALSQTEAIAIVERFAGEQFDPDIARVFVRMVEGMSA